MEIIWLLGFIALIAVIFGVSMHDAFWGIVTFIVGAIIVSILVFYIKSFYTRVNNKIAYLKTPAGKAAQKRKIANKMSNLFGGFMLFMCVFYPIVMTALMATIFKDFAQNNIALVLAIVLLPSPIIVAIVLRRAIKKARQK